jgi:TonB family protein
VNGAIGSLAKGLSGGTQIEAPGPGGEAFANYEQFVKSVYDHAWIAPDDISDDGLTVRVRVTIRRDGNVVRESTHVERTSGNPALDTSVRRAVERVKFVHPFPEGAKDTERTFKINFNLKSKRQAG